MEWEGLGSCRFLKKYIFFSSTRTLCSNRARESANIYWARMNKHASSFNSHLDHFTKTTRSRVSPKVTPAVRGTSGWNPGVSTQSGAGAAHPGTPRWTDSNELDHGPGNDRLGARLRQPDRAAEWPFRQTLRGHRGCGRWTRGGQAPAQKPDRDGVAPEGRGATKVKVGETRRAREQQGGQESRRVRSRV